MMVSLGPSELLVLVVLLFVVVGIAGFYSGRRNKRNPLREARKTWNKQR